MHGCCSGSRRARYLFSAPQADKTEDEKRPLFPPPGSIPIMLELLSYKMGALQLNKQRFETSSERADSRRSRKGCWETSRRRETGAALREDGSQRRPPLRRPL